MAAGLQTSGHEAGSRTPTPRKVVAIITHFDPGGAQQAIRRLTETLGEKGHDVELWGLYSKAPPENIPAGAQILLQGERLGAIGYLRVVGRLWRRLAAERPDAVIAFLPLACVLGLSCARLLGIRSRIASQRNPPWTYGRLMQILDKVVGSLGVYTANVANSQAVATSFDHYPRPYRQRIRVVYNGVEARVSSLSPTEARRRFGLPEGVPLVVNVGRLSAQKNQSLLLDMTADLPGLHLAIAGDGPLRASLEAQARRLGIETRLHLLGNLDNRRLPELLRAADIFALSSIFEGQSNALLEAMSAGLPVLASDIPSQSEVILAAGEPEAGLVLPLNEPEVWAQAAGRLLKDQDLRKALAEAAKGRAAGFTFDKMAEGFAAALMPRSADKPLSIAL